MCKGGGQWEVGMCKGRGYLKVSEDTKMEMRGIKIRVKD